MRDRAVITTASDAEERCRVGATSCCGRRKEKVGGKRREIESAARCGSEETGKS